MKETSKNILARSWIAQRWEQKFSDKWVLYAESPLKNFIWHFGPVKEISQGLHGKMIRIFSHSEPATENFSYFPRDAKLYIEDPSEESRDERYRVIPQGNDVLFLYIFDDMSREPEDHIYRIVLKKLGHIDE